MDMCVYVCEGDIWQVYVFVFVYTAVIYINSIVYMA